MLAPDDRSVLLDLLRPPPSMVLEVAVATTFTLDLEAALVAPLAFAAFDSTGPGDPIATLEAVRSVAERLTVFCQAGAVSVPARASDLFTFLEPVVHQVRRPRPGHLFHPKLWLLRYGSEEASALRLIVPTRNLTNDASWDAVLCLDGTVGSRPRAGNRPISDLIRWCLQASINEVGPERRALIDSLLGDLRRAEWTLPPGVNDAAFYALGVPGGARPDYSGRCHLVISPFVRPEGLEIVAPSADVIVVSRPEQVDLLPPAVVGAYDWRAMASMGAGDPDVDDDEVSDASTEAAPESLGDLHAKVVVTERARRAHLFVGSANATGPAFGGNVEVVVELIGGSKALGVQATLDDLGPVLEPCSVAGGKQLSESERLQRRLDALLRDVGVAALTLTVGEESPAGYNLRIESSGVFLPHGIEAECKLELLSRPGFTLRSRPGERLHGSFDAVPLADITPFVVVRIELRAGEDSVSGGTVLRARLVGDPPARYDAVIARQVDSPAKFLRFLLLMLSLAGGAVPPWLRSAVASEDDADSGDGYRRLLDAGVFEAVSRALVANVGAIDDLDRLVTRLRATPEGQATMPSGFEALWTSVVQARERIGAEA